MLARLLIAALLSQGVHADDFTPRQRQAKLAREAAIALQVHAAPDAEREAVLAARMVELARKEPPALWIWAQCDPWLRAVAVLGAAGLAALASMAWLAARPATGTSRA